MWPSKQKFATNKERLSYIVQVMIKNTPCKTQIYPQINQMFQEVSQEYLQFDKENYVIYFTELTDANFFIYLQQMYMHAEQIHDVHFSILQFLAIMVQNVRQPQNKLFFTTNSQVVAILSQGINSTVENVREQALSILQSFSDQLNLTTCNTITEYDANQLFELSLSNDISVQSKAIRYFQKYVTTTSQQLLTSEQQTRILIYVMRISCFLLNCMVNICIQLSQITEYMCECPGTEYMFIQSKQLQNRLIDYVEWFYEFRPAEGSPSQPFPFVVFELIMNRVQQMLLSHAVDSLTPLSQTRIYSQQQISDPFQRIQLRALQIPTDARAHVFGYNLPGVVGSSQVLFDPPVAFFVVNELLELFGVQIFAFQKIMFEKLGIEHGMDNIYNNFRPNLLEDTVQALFQTDSPRLAHGWLRFAKLTRLQLTASQFEQLSQMIAKNQISPQFVRLFVSFSPPENILQALKSELNDLLKLQNESREEQIEFYAQFSQKEVQEFVETQLKNQKMPVETRNELVVQVADTCGSIEQIIEALKEQE
ncbi:Conserved_hypothetical protein [Hexamita inflata]|uniref:FPL domain-containing protein n=1 Tax=Hexamita inflata TaxID=28002 RepID=A0AA86ULZ0_9EUKA|nr:Conserved hypothetical protein [Hexamita inflata]